MHLLIATTNPGKAREYKSVLAGLDLDLGGLKDVGINVEVEENGSTYIENAELKARAYAAMSGLLTLADDSGLEVDALNGRPGIHSARYAPDSATRIQKMLAEMSNVPDDQRTARFQCAIVLAWPPGRTPTGVGMGGGLVVPGARGGGGCW